LGSAHCPAFEDFVKNHNNVNIDEKIMYWIQ